MLPLNENDSFRQNQSLSLKENISIAFGRAFDFIKNFCSSLSNLIERVKTISQEFFNKSPINNANKNINQNITSYQLTGKIEQQRVVELLLQNEENRPRRVNQIVNLPKKLQSLKDKIRVDLHIGKTQYSYNNDTQILGRDRRGNLIYFAKTACSPLAVAFACTPSKNIQTTGNPVAEFMDDFFSADKVERGIKLLQNNRREVEENGSANLDAGDGLQVYNAMYGKKIEEIESYAGRNTYDLQKGVLINNPKKGTTDIKYFRTGWYKEVLSEIPEHGGACCIIGGSSFGVRRYGANVYEIFDPHGDENLKGNEKLPTAFIVHCESKEALKEVLAFLYDERLNLAAEWEGDDLAISVFPPQNK